MTASAALAFLHHVFAFALAAVLMVELVLMKEALTLASARSLLRMDAAYGFCALGILIVGFLRVFHTEKGADYYFGSVPFIIKIVLFAIMGLVSIYPTKQFLSWRKILRQGELPRLEGGERRRMRMIVHLELSLLLLIILCAVLMARGIGFIG